MKIAIDFDGTLVKRRGLPRFGDFAEDEPQEYAKDALSFLESRNIDYYILTARAQDDWQKIKIWLLSNGFPEGIEITNVKKRGTTLVIDDRAIRFTNWLDICKYFE